MVGGCSCSVISAAALKYVRGSASGQPLHEVEALERCADVEGVVHLLAPVVELAPDSSYPYPRARLVMALARGGDLSALAVAWRSRTRACAGAGASASAGASMSPQGIPQAMAVPYLRDIAAALADVHARGIAHCDIKGSNVLLGGDGRARLADFGSAFLNSNGGGGDRGGASHGSDCRGGANRNVPPTQSQQERGERGSLRWTAPELLRPQPPAAGTELLARLQAADVWAFGCTILELLTGCPPWWDLTADTAEATVTLLSTDVRGALPSWLSPAAANAARRCLHPRPSARPRAQELLSLTLFEGVGSCDKSCSARMPAPQTMELSTCASVDCSEVACNCMPDQRRLARLAASARLACRAAQHLLLAAVGTKARPLAGGCDNGVRGSDNAERAALLSSAASLWECSILSHPALVDAHAVAAYAMAGALVRSILGSGAVAAAAASSASSLPHALVYVTLVFKCDSFPHIEAGAAWLGIIAALAAAVATPNVRALTTAPEPPPKIAAAGDGALSQAEAAALSTVLTRMLIARSRAWAVPAAPAGGWAPTNAAEPTACGPTMTMRGLLLLQIWRARTRNALHGRTRGRGTMREAATEAAIGTAAASACATLLSRAHAWAHELNTVARAEIVLRSLKPRDAHEAALQREVGVRAAAADQWLQRCWTLAAAAAGVLWPWLRAPSSLREGRRFDDGVACRFYPPHQCMAARPLSLEPEGTNNAQLQQSTEPRSLDCVAPWISCESTAMGALFLVDEKISTTASSDMTEPPRGLLAAVEPGDLVVLSKAAISNEGLCPRGVSTDGRGNGGIGGGSSSSSGSGGNDGWVVVRRLDRGAPLSVEPPPGALGWVRQAQLLPVSNA